MDRRGRAEDRFAIRMISSAGWESFDATPIKKGFLLLRRGGLAPEKCVWRECVRARVLGEEVCLDHLYDQGVRA